MLNRLTIRNFKRFEDITIELDNPVVFVGPNNMGKTSALQALALWEIGARRWLEKYGAAEPGKRSGVAINRKDLIPMPVPEAKLLWRDLHIRESEKQDGKPRTKNVRIEILVEGVSSGKSWECGLEFDYANVESIYCRPLRNRREEKSSSMEIPEEAAKIRIAYLPSMSGLAANEKRLDLGAIQALIREGRTAEVLRNLCHLTWEKLQEDIKKHFGVELEESRYIPERGEITMSNRENNNRLDISCAAQKSMEDAITELEEALKSLKKPSPGGDELKVSDEFLKPLLEKLYEKSGLNPPEKAPIYMLAEHLSPEKMGPEITEVLDEIVETSKK